MADGIENGEEKKKRKKKRKSDGEKN